MVAIQSLLKAMAAQEAWRRGPAASDVRRKERASVDVEREKRSRGTFVPCRTSDPGAGAGGVMRLRG
jgi:hypothetical protein